MHAETARGEIAADGGFETDGGGCGRGEEVVRKKKKRWWRRWDARRRTADG